MSLQMEVKNTCVLLLVVSALNLVTVRSEKLLPSYFPVCWRDDPNLDGCLLKATETVKPFLKKGVPELNIPSISPFHIPQITLEQGTDAVNYKATLSDIVMTGLDDYHFTTFQYDVPKQYFSGEVKIPRLSITAKYAVNGRILTVPLAGNGHFRANITNSNGTMTQHAKLVTRKGVTYLEPNISSVKIDVGETEQDVDGLFDGNEILAQAVRDTVKDNIRELITEVKPAIEKVMTKIVVELIYKSISKVPYDKLYPTHS